MAKYLTSILRNDEMVELMQMVQRETDPKTMVNADFETRLLLKIYLDYAKITTKIELSMVFICTLLFVMPYFIGIVTYSWILPMTFKIPGVRLFHNVW